MSDEPETPAAKPSADDAKPAAETPPPPHHEESVVETKRVVTVGRKKIAYTATAGRTILREEDGKKKASFFSVAYTRDGDSDPASRPIVFCFNGGPGSSSVWLHLGAFGPRRVLLNDEGMPGPGPGRLVDNADAILDVADIVFIDPVGTGYSRPIPDDDLKQYTHFKRDIESVGEFVRLYLTRHARWASPKFLAGESYGTTRSAGLAAHLYKRHGIAFNGLLLISSILNFQTAGFDSKTWTFERGNDLPYIVFLPTYAATAWYHGRVGARHRKRPLREFLDEVEAFAAGDYAWALFQGDRLEQLRFDEVAARVADYTGLSAEYVSRYDLRIEILRFCKELLREERRTVGRIDSRYTGIDRFVDGDAMEADPSMDATNGPYTSALNDYLRRELGYESELPYEILSEKVHESWDYEDFKNTHVDVSEALRETVSRNPSTRVFVANGYYDLATPHFATEYTFSHLGLDPSLRGNVELAYFEAGHMMYVHTPSRTRLAADVKSFITRAAAG
jgi:carboxypeptidase C (cathepsin A)